MLVPSILLITVLWITQTMFLGMFYAAIKTEELKNTTEDVIENIEKNDIHDKILFWSSNGNINIRVIETAEFESLYSTGDVFDSVTYGIGTFGMLEMYEEALENGGELVRYYSEEDNYEEFFMPPEGDVNRELPPPAIPFDESGFDEERKNFRQHFRMVPRPAFFDNVGKHNDLLYVRITTLSDGSEVMVAADTRISPLDSTVKALKVLLIWGTVITVISSLILSYIMAKKISKPIEKTTNSAKVLASGDFNVGFDGKGYREIEELNDTLNYASSELAKVEELRKELMANVSHDMRTPLTMIVGYGEVMRDIPGENNAENIQVIIDEANRLSEFVNSILDLSKLRNGMEVLELDTVDMDELVRKNVERYTKLVPDAEFVYESGFDKEVLVECDVTKITRVLHNLMDNAVNYALDPKKIVVRSSLSEGAVRIEISDNGEGISKEELPYIWDRYYKSEKSHRRNVVGSGIGLSIVKEILKKHNARFGVESVLNKGSTFWFELETM